MAYNPSDHYWIVATNSTERWAGARGIFVETSDAEYIAWDSIDGNDATNIATEQDLWDVIAKTALATHLGGAGGYSYLLIESAVDVQLTNPISRIYDVSFSVENKKLVLPQLNLPVSPPIGLQIYFRNVGALAFDVAAFGSFGLPIGGVGINPGEVFAITNMNFSSPSGQTFASFAGLTEGGDGQLGLDRGGTGGQSAAEARTNLELGDVDNTSDADKPVSTAQQAAIDAVGLSNDRGNYDASVNTFPASGGSGTAGAVEMGNAWFISVAGALGGVAVGVGAQVRSLVDAPGQTAGNWSISNASVTLTAAQTLTNKTLTAPVINTPTGIVKADVGLGNVDNTSNATERAAAATLANKTLASPVINTPTGIVKGDVGLGNVDNTSNATERAAAATLANKTLASPVINTPTGIVKADVGLGNVDNTSDATKNAASAVLTGKTLNSPVINTPTGIVKGDVGLGNVDNTSNATERTAAATLANKTLNAPVINNPTGIVKGDVGLGNVDNTSDAAKPVSTATAAAILTRLAIADNLADLDSPTAARENLGLGNVENTADWAKPVSDATAVALAAVLSANGGEANGSEVNGGVAVSQELGTTGATLTNNTNKYTADMWEAMYNHGAATAVVTSGQVAAASFPAAIPGFSFAHQIKATTALSSLANGDFARHRHQIEGYRVARYGWGAAGAFTAAILARWYVTTAGTGFIRVTNAAGNRAYHREVVLAAGLNTVREVIPGDTSGTWEKTTSAGMIVDFFPAGKSASPATPDAWGATPATQTTNSTNMLDTNNNLSLVTGLKVLPVVSALELPPSDRLPLLMRPFDQEMVACKRYFERIGPSGMLGQGMAVTTTNSYIYVRFEQLKRIDPTITVNSVTNMAIIKSNGDTQSAVTNDGNFAINTRNCLVSIGVASGLVAGNATSLIDLSGSSIDASARL